MPRKPIFLEADPLRIEQILTNLLTNASKFSPPGSPIHVCVASIADDERVELRVRDVGIGINADTMPQIFEAFTQGTHDYAETRGGLGIGLTLVRTLVELHRGTVEARSDGEGKGSELIVSLPQGTPQPETVPSPRSPRTETSRRRIMVVDDNVDAGESLAMLLRLDDHSVDVVGDPHTALEEAAALRPDILILDIGLPGMDGYQLARKLRQVDGLHNAYMIALTGYGSEEDRARAEGAGFNNYLVKPVDFGVLTNLIGHVPSR